MASYRPYVEAGLARLANWRVRLSFFLSQQQGPSAYSELKSPCPKGYSQNLNIDNKMLNISVTQMGDYDL